MITGFYVLDLALRGKKKLAEKYLEGINIANSKAQTKKPMGTKLQAWSAAASVMGYHALKTPNKIFL
jgi:hypothetical protein